MRVSQIFCMSIVARPCFPGVQGPAALLCRTTMGLGRYVQMGVYCSLKNVWSIGILDSLALWRVLVTVLTCHSMIPWDCVLWLFLQKRTVLTVVTVVKTSERTMGTSRNSLQQVNISFHPNPESQNLTFARYQGEICIWWRAPNDIVFNVSVYARPVDEWSAGSWRCLHAPHAHCVRSESLRVVGIITWDAWTRYQ